MFVPHGITVQVVVNFVWFLFDLVIAFTHWKFGRAEFAELASARWFTPWTLLTFAIAISIVAGAAMQMGTTGEIYTAFLMNVLMSALFIGMFVRRSGVHGQSMWIAVLKCIGTLAPTIQIWLTNHDVFVLAMGVSCFSLDVIYIVLLSRRHRDFGINRWTRRPLTAPAPVTA